MVKRDIHAFVAGPFKAHGQIEMWREGQVVRLRAQGPFNREAVHALGRAMQDLLAKDPPQGRFCDILELQSSMMTSPEGMRDFEQFLQHMGQQRQPPLAVAWVAQPDVEGRDFMLPLFEALYQKHGRRFRAFETLAQAQDWVATHLDAPPST